MRVTHVALAAWLIAAAAVIHAQPPSFVMAAGRLREVASVIPAADAPAIITGPPPKPNEARVDLLKGGDYFRIWIDHDGTTYIINLPPAE